MFKNLLERVLDRFVTDNRFSTVAQSQLEAFSDLLAIAMIIDRHIAEDERDAISEALEQFDWPGARPSEHFVNRSVHRAWDILAGEEPHAEVLAYCKDIAARLEDDWLRENAFIATIRIINADNKIEPDEADLIDYIQKAFDLDDERVRTLTARAESNTPASGE